MPQPTVTLNKDKGDHRGTVRLSVFGFKQQNVLKIEDIVKAVDAIPNAHLEGLSEIRFDPNREMASYLSVIFNRPHINRFRGEFLYKLRSIVLYEITDEKLFLHTLYHEIGHHVYFRVIGSELKKEWVKTIHPKSKSVTNYAARNACEDFAECYAFYKIAPDKLREIPSKYWFLKEKIYNDYQADGHFREYRF